MSRTERIERVLRDHYRDVTEADSPALFKTVRRLTEKAGVEMPSVHFMKPGPGYSSFEKMLDYTIGVAPREKGKALLVGNRVMEIMNGTTDIKNVSKEMEAILAHEVGHLKHNDLGSFGIKRIAMHSPLIGIAAAIGATAYASHYYKNKKLGKESSPEEKLPGEKGYAEPSGQDLSHPLDWAVTTAKYLAASVIGLGAGVMVMRQLHHHMEFRADSFSAKMMASGKPLADALEKFYHAGLQEKMAATEKMREYGVPEEAIKRNSRINNFIKDILHPPVEKRIERLRGM